MTNMMSEGVPSLERLLEMATAETPAAVLRARARSSMKSTAASSASVAVSASASTTEPFDALVSRSWSTEKTARKGLEEYTTKGKAAFADRHFIASEAANLGDGLGYGSIRGRPNNKSMYAAAAARIINQPQQNQNQKRKRKQNNNHRPSDVLALREAPTRAFTSALALGSLSPRDVVDAARNRSPVTPPAFPALKNERANEKNRAGLLPSDDPLWGRSSEGSLSDVVEWREWYRLLAERSLAIQEAATSGGEAETETAMGGDLREAGTVKYWRWKGQYLVRYMTWPAGKDYDGLEEEDRDPAMLLVHGFAASAEQWERLVHSLRRQNVETSGSEGKDTTPPIFAVDLLGFGHSEKPSLSYTQYLWEAQVVDFAVEVMEATPMVLVGNSIGGGLSAGAAASLGRDVCRGLVLCNTAGVIQDPDAYEGYPATTTGGEDSGIVNPDITTYTEAAMEGNPNEKAYAPVPVFGNNALDLFGRAVIKFIYPQIDERLSLIYGNRLMNADEAVSYAIKQSAVGPGSANVIGSGQKLSENRPLNEVLLMGGVGDNIGGGEGDMKGFPTLVVMGLEDKVSSPAVARSRAELFSRLSPESIVVEAIEKGGHCPHDEVPDMVAGAMIKWLSSSKFVGRRLPVQMEAVSAEEASVGLKEEVLQFL